MSRTAILGRTWIGALVVVVGCLIAYLPTVDTKQANPEPYSASFQAWWLVNSGSPDLAELGLPPQDTAPGNAFGIVTTDDGSVVAHRSPGQVAAAAAAYWIESLGSGKDTDPTTFDSKTSSYLAVAITAGAMALLFLALRRHVPQATALAATGVVALGTPVWAVSANWMWSHPVTLLGVAGLAWAASRDRWLVAGLFGGIALWGAVPAALILLAVVVGSSVWRRDWRPVALAGITALPVAGLLVAWTQWLYGDWLPAASFPPADLTRPDGVGELLTNQLGQWLSLDRGLLVITPALLLLAPSVVRNWRELPDWSRLLLLGGIAYALAQGCLTGFAGGTGFNGYRLMLEPMLCAVPAAVFSLPRMGRVASLALFPVLTLMLAASTWAATSDKHWLPVESAWRNNAYVHELFASNPLEPAPWIWLVIYASGCYYAMRWWLGRRAPSQVGQPSEA